MNEAILQEAGLTNAEAKIYLLLVKNSPSSPPALAEMAEESRTNTYKLLDSLEEKGLVSRDDTQKKLRYWANNPSALLDTLKKRREEVESAEKRFQNSLPAMVDEYFLYSEQPSIRYFHGKDGVQKVYEDQLATGKPLTFIHSPALIQAIGIEQSHLLRNKFPEKNIPRHMFYADIAPIVRSDEPRMPVEESDRLMQATRTWLQEGDLQEPVEWSVYDNKLSIVSLGSELIGMIIESPQIATSFREILTLLDRKIRAEPTYHTLPLNHLYTKMPESAKNKRNAT